MDAAGPRRSSSLALLEPQQDFLSAGYHGGSTLVDVHGDNDVIAFFDAPAPIEGADSPQAASFFPLDNEVPIGRSSSDESK